MHLMMPAFLAHTSSLAYFKMWLQFTACMHVHVHLSCVRPSLEVSSKLLWMLRHNSCYRRRSLRCMKKYSYLRKRWLKAYLSPVVFRRHCLRNDLARSCVLSSPEDTSRCALQVCILHPTLFSQFYKRFLNDPREISSTLHRDWRRSRAPRTIHAMRADLRH